MLVRCLYASRPSTPLTGAVLNSILDQSRKNNPGLGVTGLLCVSEQVFMQVLEGGRDEVCELYNTIVRDKRHQQVRRAGRIAGHAAAHLHLGIGGQLAYSYGLRVPFLCAGVSLLVGGMLTALLEVGFTRHVALEYEKDDENSLPGMIKSYAYMRAHWRR